MSFENQLVRIDIVGNEQALLHYTVKVSGQRYRVAGPVFEIDGVDVPAVLSDLRQSGVRQLLNGCTEYRYEGVMARQPELSLELIFRIPDENPIMRFAYTVRSRGEQRLTKAGGKDRLIYLTLSFEEMNRLVEVQLADFVELVHSYCPVEQGVEERYFQDLFTILGPLVYGVGEGKALLVAYEHGSQVPDAFLSYQLAPDRTVSLQAVKGNYYHGQELSGEGGYRSIWLQIGAGSDQEDLARMYRTFILRHQSLQTESRKPYIYYNTWNYQERNKWWNGQTYLSSMRQERILAEIEVAHRMGIEVFVLDTGWYIKTGDWQVNLERFPDGLKAVRERLEKYGMKLGLWFDPPAVAVSSRAAQEHPACRQSWRGRQGKPQAIWETKESYKMCLVSEFADHFADELIRLSREVGVTYFKWDAIQQYGCDDPGHAHGQKGNSQQERADCYAFELIRAMTRIVERVSEAVPEAIVDFDVTEAGRPVGLSFLSVGKYFLINNGPYYPNYNIPFDEQHGFNNIFVYPGAARTWICRSPLVYDRWLPSVLFLTHYLPDDPTESQIINIASLILGQNGIWGDLLQLSQEGIDLFGGLLARYKEVRDDITHSYPVHRGKPGGSPEIYEKIWDESGRGAVVLFSTARGTHTYITQRRVAAKWWSSQGVEVTLDGSGRARLEAVFEKEGARIVFFGVQ